MKNRRFYLLSLLVILLITVGSCEDDASSPISFLSSKNTRPLFLSEGGTTSFSFTAAGDWTAAFANTHSDDWITISPTSGGKGNAKITITVMPNDTNNERSAIITLNCEGNSEEIIVTQKPKDRSSIERAALIALYKATNGDKWTNNTNWCSNKPVGEWYGVGVGSTGVQDIILPENGLKGSIPKEIGNMVSLKEFDIANYTFSAAGGTIVIDPETGEVTGGRTAQNSISGPHSGRAM